MKQYHKIEEWKLAYFAGILDGEGCICINKYKITENKYGYRASIQIAMTDKMAISWIQDNFGGQVYDVKAHKYMQKPYFQWTMRAVDVAILLKMALPFILVKKSQALNLIRFADTVEITGRNGMKKEVVELRESIYWSNKKLNQKGIYANLS